MVLTISLLVCVWKVNWNSEFTLLHWLWLNASGHIWQIRECPWWPPSHPIKRSPGPSCWQLRWQWLGLGSAGGICQGWPASKSHHLEWAKEEKRIREKQPDAEKSFLARSWGLTGHHFFSHTAATNWLQRNHPVTISTSHRYSKPTSNLSLFHILINSSPVSANLPFTSPSSLSADDLVSYFREKIEAIQLCAHVPTTFFFSFFFICIFTHFHHSGKLSLLLPKGNAHASVLNLPLRSQAPSSISFPSFPLHLQPLSLLSSSHKPLPCPNLFYTKRILLQHYAFPPFHFCHGQASQKSWPSEMYSTYFHYFTEMPRSPRTFLLLSSKNTVHSWSYLIFLKHSTQMDIFSFLTLWTPWIFGHHSWCSILSWLLFLSLHRLLFQNPPIHTGVPQDSVHSPLFFLLYTVYWGDFICSQGFNYWCTSKSIT